MNEFQKAHRQCIVGIKAFQNVRASHQALLRLTDLVNSNDHLLASSLFHSAVIRYAKPFIQTKMSTGQIKYKIKLLKNEDGFNITIHNHIISIRNTLIAHDDIEILMPKILTEGMHFSKIGKNCTNFFIPMAVTISNKCLSHPSDGDSVNKISEHVASALSGIQKKIYADIGTFREVALTFPDQAEAERTRLKTYQDGIIIPPGGTRITPPDTSNDPWLDAEVPDFSDVHAGFRYETLSLRRQYSGPEEINIPGEGRVVISP